jgi:hypothetical protein
MPAKAIATGLVDIVLPIEEMADRLVQLANGRSPQGGLAEHKLENKTEEIDEAKLVITRILEKQLGHDFSGYKGKTFIRRALRRMQITQFDELARYIERLRADSDEVTALFRDLLIGVTHFFRDSEAFAALEIDYRTTLGRLTCRPLSFSSRPMSPSVLVFGCRHDVAIRALRRPATEKRQGTKSRDVGDRLTASVKEI